MCLYRYIIDCLSRSDFEDFINTVIYKGDIDEARRRWQPQYKDQRLSVSGADEWLRWLHAGRMDGPPLCVHIYIRWSRRPREATGVPWVWHRGPGWYCERQSEEASDCLYRLDIGLCMNVPSMAAWRPCGPSWRQDAASPPSIRSVSSLSTIYHLCLQKGETTLMMADRRGHHECASLLRSSNETVSVSPSVPSLFPPRIWQILYYLLYWYHSNGLSVTYLFI